MNRRQDVIDAAVALIREGGPSALTTVAVAGRLGVTQSAIYRHVHSVGELASLASRVIVTELQAELDAALDAPGAAWGEDNALPIYCERLVRLMAAAPQSFELIDRWRYAEGDLGAGIRGLLDQAVDGTGRLLESLWRQAFDDGGELDESALAAMRVHASLVNDDVINVARRVRDPESPADRAALARILELRLIAGQLAFNGDMNRRLGLPAVIN